ncbi:LPXTG cell wall anchor domain-containing protein [Enterococcus raffinosus]|uniref:LPXTG cell wall anchor domain-containing protein n=1 Tax=Enterococcus raffinosus TaxID=71452 RepID=UPI003AC2E355
MPVIKWFRIVGLVVLLGIGNFLLPSVEGTAASSEQPTIVAYDSEKEIASAEHPLEPKPDYLYKEPMQDAVDVGDTGTSKVFPDTLPQTGSRNSFVLILVGILFLWLVLVGAYFLQSEESTRKV